MKSNKTVTLPSGRTAHISCLNNDELQAVLERTDKKLCPQLHQAITRELGKRPVALDPVYKPVTTTKVKNAAGVDVEVRVGGYQPFSGGSQQTTDRYGKKGKPVPLEWI